MNNLLSCTIKLSIDPEFEELITKPNDAEYSMLKDSIIKEGIREPIIVWNNTIIDGHNRYKIAQELGIPVKCKTIQFENKEEAKEWIISNQLGRRNISKYERCRLVLNMKERISAKAKDRMLAGKSDPTKKSAEGETRQILAKIAAVSHDTLKKVEILERDAVAEIKEKLRAGEISINAAYKQLQDHQSTDSTDTQIDSSANNSNFVSSRVSDIIKENESSNTALDVSNDKEEVQQNENTDQNLKEKAAVTSDSKKSLKTSEMGSTTEASNQVIISFLKNCNDYINEFISSSHYYSIEENLQKVWSDSIILCPSVELIDSFIEKLNNSNVSEALFIIPQDYDKKVIDNIRNMSIPYKLSVMGNEWHTVLFFTSNETSGENDTSSD